MKVSCPSRSWGYVSANVGYIVHHSPAPKVPPRVWLCSAFVCIHCERAKGQFLILSSSMMDILGYPLTPPLDLNTEVNRGQLTIETLRLLPCPSTKRAGMKEVMEVLRSS